MCTLRAAVLCSIVPTDWEPQLPRCLGDEAENHSLFIYMKMETLSFLFTEVRKRRKGRKEERKKENRMCQNCSMFPSASTARRVVT